MEPARLYLMTSGEGCYPSWDVGLKRFVGLTLGWMAGVPGILHSERVDRQKESKGKARFLSHSTLLPVPSLVGESFCVGI